MLATTETDRILNDIRTYMRISAAAASRLTASKVIDLQEKANVYSKMDGQTTQTKIESLTGVPNQTISRWVDEFVEAGIASPPNEYYLGPRALFSLRELAIDTAQLKKRAKAANAAPGASTGTNSSSSNDGQGKPNV